MASTSLGTLTLDLAVRLSEFTDGLSRAERETRDSTENMGSSVGKFKEQLIADLSGTPIGGAIDLLNEKLGSITEAFGEGGLAGAAKIGAASVIGSVVAIGAGLIALAVETAEADRQLVLLADKANTTTRNLQVLSAAASDFGLDMEGVTDVLADAREKFGEFSATGGGGLVDTLELLQKSTKMTDAEIAKFGREITTVDTVDAITMVENALADANVTTQEARFVNESLASGLDDIAPVWANNAEILKQVDAQLEQTGVIRTQESIDQSAILSQQIQDTTVQFNGLKNQLVTATLPAISGLIDYMSGGTDASKDLGSNLSVVGSIAKGVASFVIGLSTAFKTVAYTIAGASMALFSFYDLSGKMLTSPLDAIQHFAEFRRTIDNAITFTKQDIHDAWMAGGTAINKIYDPQVGNLVTGAGNNVSSSYTPPATTDSSGRSAASKENTTAVKENTKATQELLRKVVLGGKDWGITPGNGFGGARGHNGIDIPTPRGTQVYAPESGTVSLSGSNSGRGGKQLVLIGESGKRYGFAHLDSYDVANGAQVSAGMGVAKTGGTGTRPNGKGYNPHLHLTVTQNGKKVDPANIKVGGTSSNIKYDATVGNANAKAADDTQRQREKEAAEAERDLQDMLRRQGSITAKYATEREKIESEHLANVAEIKALYAEGSAKRDDLLAREEVEYIDAKNAKAKSILAQYLTGEAKLKYEHGLKLKAIDDANVEDDSARQALVDEQNKAYQEDLANFRWAAQAKLREQDKLYQSIAESARANGINSVATGLDAMAQRTMNSEDYAGWRLAQDHDESFDSVNNQYTNRQSEINGRDERGEFNLPELERYELLEIAKQEHLDNMWALEQEYALRQQSLDEQQAAQRVAIYQSLFAGMTNAASVFFGENSRMHKVAFALEKAYAVHKALMNVKETYSNTFNSLSAIPLIGPYIAMPGAVAASALQVATAAGIQGMAAPSVAGIAHGGLDNVPSESTYLLDKGERVLSPKQNKDITNFIAEGRAKNAGVVVNNYSSAKIEQRQDANGMTILEVRNEIKRGFTDLRNPNSHNAKMVQASFNTTVKR